MTFGRAVFLCLPCPPLRSLQAWPWASPLSGGGAVGTGTSWKHEKLGFGPLLCNWAPFSLLVVPDVSCWLARKRGTTLAQAFTQGHLPFQKMPPEGSFPIPGMNPGGLPFSDVK